MKRLWEAARAGLVEDETVVLYDGDIPGGGRLHLVTHRPGAKFLELHRLAIQAKREIGQDWEAVKPLLAVSLKSLTAWWLEKERCENSYDSNKP